MRMFRIICLVCLVCLATGLIASAAVAQNEKISPLISSKNEAWEKARSSIPVQRIIDVNEFKKIYDRVLKGELEAYLVDVRTHPEFEALHIPYTDHIPSGRSYTFPKNIKNSDVMIVVWCRTNVRSAFVAQKLVDFGYTDVWIYEDGVRGWIDAGYEMANEHAGLFKVTQYHKRFMEVDPKTGNPMYRIREFKP